MSTLSEDIVNEVRDKISSIEIPEIRMVAISLGYTFVELENDAMGVCFTPRSDSGSCSHYNGAGTLSKKSLSDLCGLMLSNNPLERSVGVAAVNVASRIVMDSNPDSYHFAEKDFLDLIPFEKGPVKVGKVGMVGNIGPFIPFLVKKAESLVVIDDNPAFLPGMKQNGYTISRNIKDIADADVVIITGSAAAVGDFDSVISISENASFIGVVGPSAGWLPDPAFRRGVHAVAATRIVDTRGARCAILEGGGTPHFINYGEKYTVINRSL